MSRAGMATGAAPADVRKGGRSVALPIPSGRASRSRSSEAASRPDKGAPSVAERVAALAAVDRVALLALWSATMGGPVPASLSQPMLRRILAWELQARAQGGLSAAARRTLDGLAAAQASGSKRPSPAPRLKPGGRLLREWGGVTHVVDVVEGGFLWRGERHRSLSAIAQAITGAHWSGPRFFGLGEGIGRAGASGAKKAAATSARTSRRAA